MINKIYSGPKIRVLPKGLTYVENNYFIFNIKKIRNQIPF